MKTSLFERLEMTRGETAVYIALLYIGESTITAIGRKSKVSKSKLYDILDKLIDKGLVGYIIRNGVKHFSSNGPNAIIDLVMKKQTELEQTKQEAEELVKELALQKPTQQLRVCEVFEGFYGMKAIREELIKNLKFGDTFRVLGAPRVANEKWEAWFLEFHKIREKRGVGMQIIYNSNAREFGKKRKLFPKTQVRYLPNNLVSPVWMDIYEDSILFIFTIQETLAIVIRNKDLATSFKTYFNIMWQVSKE